MVLTLILDELSEDSRLDFCNYIIEQLTIMFKKAYDKNKTVLLEEYLNSHNNIKQIIPKKAYYSVYELYNLALDNLIITEVDENIYEIIIDKFTIIPNSYTYLYPIISLFEYGSLSVRKYGLLNECMETIANNLTQYYIKYLGTK